MSFLQGVAARQALNTAKGILLDWDGCLAVNNRLTASAVKLIARHLDRIAIISNNSTNLPEDFVDILHNSGLAVRPERIFTAGAETIRHIAEQGNPRVLMLAAPKMRRLARDRGVWLVRDEPDIVLLMRDARFTYAKLERAANAVRGGARLVVANADRTHPGPAGRLVPETGALLAALLACVGEQPTMHVVGKPGPLLFECACRCLGILPQDAVMIGDNPETDGEGARHLGMRSIIVGGDSPLRMEDLLNPEAPPALVRSA